VKSATADAITDNRRPAPSFGRFERYLTLWVALCIVAGVVLGRLSPAPFHALGRITAAEVNLPVAALVWLMIVSMLLKSISALCTGSRSNGAVSPSPSA
jgi:arsenite transporter